MAKYNSTVYKIKLNGIRIVILKYLLELGSKNKPGQVTGFSAGGGSVLWRGTREDREPGASSQ